MIIPKEIKYLSGWIYQNNTQCSVFNMLKTISVFNLKDYKKLDWNRGIIESDTSLLGEEEFKQSYRYSYFFRESKDFGTLILLTQNKEITSFIHNLLFAKSKDFLVIGVETHKIVHKILAGQSHYLTTTIHARIAGMRQKVNSISLYGMDVIRSPIYREYENNLELTSCGLGIEDRSSYNGYTEILKVSNDGTLSFPCKDPKVFKRVDRVLNFIYDCFNFYQ
ncbi:hypothetical protein [uncultured Draconibacterium sp.]|uniref:hypothetical protein n=1 Tax=uncultured Draconibacterium sp. TaxID=1573823 RepID=UPI003260CD27